MNGRKTGLHGTSLGALLLAGLQAGCGGGGPSAPSQASAVSAPAVIPSGTVLSLTSGETGGPVPGAAVTVAATAYTASERGEVVLRQAVPPGSLLDVVDPGFLDRQTLLRSTTGTRFTLWPRRSATGLDEPYTRAIVYTSEPASPGAEPLRRLRLGTRQVFVVPSPELRSDERSRSAHADALAELDSAAGDLVVYELAADGTAQGVVVETRVESSHPVCTETATTRVTGATILHYRSDEIERAEIVFCELRDARNLATVTHELGHTFGLRHSPDPRELMAALQGPRHTASFSARERLTMRLLMERRGGTRFPDNDRDTQGLSRRNETIVCR
jgi:hypothetical protein